MADVAALCLTVLQVMTPTAVAQRTFPRAAPRNNPDSPQQAVARAEAERQAEASATPVFKWSGPTIAFKSRCFSGVCLGDDAAKLSSLNIGWLGAARSAQGTRFIQIVDAAYRGLSEVDQVTLAAALTPAFEGFTESPSYRTLVPMGPGGGSDYIVLNANTVKALSKATLCAVLPALGIFKSESGHYTSVLMLPEDGKLAVVRIERQWILDVPQNASNVQQSQVVSQELKELSNQIGDVYVASWAANDHDNTTVEAISEDTVAYFTWSDMTKPKLTFYSRALAAFQRQNRDYDQRFKWGGGETGIDWEKLSSFVNGTLSAAAGCEVKPAAVKIN